MFPARRPSVCGECLERKQHNSCPSLCSRRGNFARIDLAVTDFRNSTMGFSPPKKKTLRLGVKVLTFLQWSYPYFTKVEEISGLFRECWIISLNPFKMRIAIRRVSNVLCDVQKHVLMLDEGFHHIGIKLFSALVFDNLYRGSMWHSGFIYPLTD